MKKKTILYSGLFVLVIILSFYIFSSMQYNQMKFTIYASIDTETKLNTNRKFNLNQQEINFVTFTNNTKTQLKIEKLTTYTNNVTTIVYIDTPVPVLDYNLLSYGDTYYFLYNTNQFIIQYNSTAKSLSFYENADRNLIFINPYSLDIYMYNQNSLISITNDKKISIHPSISPIKSIEFLTQSIGLINTYNNELYYYDFTDGVFTKFEHNYLNFSISSSNIIGIYTNKEKQNVYDVIDLNDITSITTFQTKFISYNSMQVVEDYIYLIQEKEVHKISISHQKSHETLKMGSYSNSIYSLNTLLIINEKEMYLPLIKKESDTSYHNYLYRYKI